MAHGSMFPTRCAITPCRCDACDNPDTRRRSRRGTGAGGVRSRSSSARGPSDDADRTVLTTRNAVRLYRTRIVQGTWIMVHRYGESAALRSLG
eukprot:7032176-Prymnesium_polylepis.1